MMAKTVNMYEISETFFNDIFQLKSYCEQQKNCYNCKIKQECKQLGVCFNGNDISCLNIGKVGKGKDLKYVIFAEDM